LDDEGAYATRGGGGTLEEGTLGPLSLGAALSTRATAAPWAHAAQLIDVIRAAASPESCLTTVTDIVFQGFWKMLFFVSVGNAWGALLRRDGLQGERILAQGCVSVREAPCICDTSAFFGRRTCLSV
jgi:hypothetical protein